MFVVALVAASSAGCNQVNLRGDGFPESFSQQSGVKRPEEKSAQPFGVSQKAREIEGDFGVK